MGLSRIETEMNTVKMAEKTGKTTTMAGGLTDPKPGQRLDRAGYVIEVEDRFEQPSLDGRLWIPCYLPHWSSRTAAAARYAVGGGTLRLLIEGDQEPWSPDYSGFLRVSSLQTGLFSGPVGSVIGQHRFQQALVVREEQQNVKLYAPQYGLFELQARAIDDPANMVAFWMIGYEDEPSRSAEICICEIFGRDIHPLSTRIGMGLHPFGDPTITDDFTAEKVAIHAVETHTYAAEWTPRFVAFYVDDRLIKVVHQSPAYPMQFMLGIYEFAERRELPSANKYPKIFAVEHFRGYRPLDRPCAFSNALDSD